MRNTTTPPAARPGKAALAGRQGAKPDQVIEELRPGQSLELLKELHILTRDGRLNQDTRRKLKQVYHLYQFIEPLLQEVHAASMADAPPTLADHGAGKSYLGFIVYDLFYNVAQRGALNTAISTASKRARSWLKNRARSRPGWALHACRF